MVQRTPVLLSPLRHFTNCKAWNISKPVVISSQRRKVGSDSNSVATDTLLLSPPVHFIFHVHLYVHGNSLCSCSCHGQLCLIEMFINRSNYISCSCSCLFI